MEDGVPSRAQFSLYEVETAKCNMHQRVSTFSLLELNLGVARGAGAPDQEEPHSWNRLVEESGSHLQVQCLGSPHVKRRKG